jgi:trans-aconitate 2-methyltransferase
MPTWDDAQYLKFADARTRPAAELLSRVQVDAPLHVVDLGCGPGNSTELLVQRWPGAEILGVDNSEPMLTRARETLPKHRFVLSDLRTYRADKPIDVLFANAALHWVPDHGQLLPALLSQLSRGGHLAFQMPDNWQEPSHRLMRELILQYVPDISAVPTHPPIESAAFYYDQLAPHAKLVDIWQTRYEQVVPDAAAIVEWVKGTGLRPYLEALQPDQRERFERDYQREIAKAYPERADGQRLFSFPRLFVVCSVR